MRKRASYRPICSAKPDWSAPTHMFRRMVADHGRRGHRRKVGRSRVSTESRRQSMPEEEGRLTVEVKKGVFSGPKTHSSFLLTFDMARALICEMNFGQKTMQDVQVEALCPVETRLQTRNKGINKRHTSQLGWQTRESGFKCHFTRIARLLYSAFDGVIRKCCSYLRVRLALVLILKVKSL